ncbi:hypothetical protein [Dyadobacter jiangsuensis]|uniref:NinB protein n=1 Tax=Dyadobacter jiangsuensis TaxID=1591085 RepID=A0A2P8FNZ8_9BACT|nr:hypothetical protein [Dyadobacter jiangsuensis]PSL23446.1 hypothetical protein CLV60_1161 [Dyadobacter jiangsuensis]
MEQTFIIANEQVRKNAMSALMDAPIGSGVSFTKKKKTRQQEKYLHVIINIICKHNGADPDDLKDDIKIPILGFTEHTHNGNTYVRVKSSKHISDDQYGKLIDAALIVADFLNIKIHPPSYYGYQFHDPRS